MKRIFGLLVFTALMLVKVSAFHVYTHDHEDCDAVENCDFCDFALELQSSDIEVPTQFVADMAVDIPSAEPFFEKNQVSLIKPGLYQLFSRPPPITI